MGGYKKTLSSFKFTEEACEKIFKLTPEEVNGHIQNMKRGISGIRFQVGWLEEHLSLTNKKNKDR